jgi:hypothetical protein
MLHPRQPRCGFIPPRPTLFGVQPSPPVDLGLRQRLGSLFILAGAKLPKFRGITSIVDASAVIANVHFGWMMIPKLFIDVLTRNANAL